MINLFELDFYPKGIPTPGTGNVIKNIYITVNSLISPKSSFES